MSHNERSRPGKGHGRVLFGATSAGRRSTWKDKQSGAVVDHVSRRSPFLCLPICPSIFPRVRHFPHGWVLGTSRQGKGSAGKPLFSHLGKGVAEFRRHRSVSSRALTRHISAPVWVGCFRCGFVLRASGWVCVFWGRDSASCSEGSTGVRRFTREHLHLGSRVDTRTLPDERSPPLTRSGVPGGILRRDAPGAPIIDLPLSVLTNKEGQTPGIGACNTARPSNSRKSRRFIQDNQSVGCKDFLWGFRGVVMCHRFRTLRR